MPAPSPVLLRSVAAALLALLALAGPAPADPGPLAPRSADASDTLAALSAWVAADRRSPEPVAMPRLVFLPLDRLREAYAAAQHAAAGDRADGSNVLAFYDGRRGAIFLPADWTGADPIERSILVHELVHHFQMTEGERFACGAAREKDAYGAQDRYLATYGLSLQASLGIEPLFVLLATNCLF